MELPVELALWPFWGELLHPNPSPSALYPVLISLFLLDWNGGDEVLLLGPLLKTHQGLCLLLEIQGRPKVVTRNCN